MVLQILGIIAAALQFPAGAAEFIKQLHAFAMLFRDTPEEKRQKISAQVSAWIKESSTSKEPGDEVEEPKWEK